MARFMWIVIVCLDLFADTASADGPFDKERLVSLSPIGVADSHGPAIPPRVNVLCGISQSLDEISICVDGSWIKKSEIISKTSAQVLRFGYLNVTLTNGKTYSVGDQLPPAKQRRAVKGQEQHK